MKVRNIIAASGIVAALGLPASTIAMADAITDLVDSYYNAKGKYEDKIMESQRAVRDAMNEGGAPRPPPPGESTINYNLRMYDWIDELYRHSDEIFRARQEPLNVGLRLMLKLPNDDPRRAEIDKELRKISGQQVAGREKRDDYHRRRQAFGQRIQEYKERTGSYPPHDCASAPGWHLPEGAKCDSAPADPHAGSSGHAP